MADFVTGFRYALAGFGLLGRPGVRLLMLAPLLINILLFTFLIYTGASLFRDLLEQLTQQWSWLEWISWLLWPLFLLLMLGIVFFSFSIAGNLLAAPFTGYLAAAVERALGAPPPAGAADRGFVNETVGALRSESEKIVFFMVRGVPLLLLFAVPLVQLVAPVLWFLYATWMIALEYLEIPLGNHGLSFQRVRLAAAERRLLVHGFGTGILLLTMIPGLNLVVMPVAIAGATRLSLERLAAPSAG